MPPEPVSPEELADAYWGHYQRRDALDEAREPRPYDPEAGDTIVAEGEGFRIVARKRSADEPDEPKTGLEWAWEMVDTIVSQGTWHDWDAQEDGRDERVAPSVDPIVLVELLAARAPDDVDDSLGWLAADALCTYMLGDPDVERVDEAATRNEVFRVVLTKTWFDRDLPPEDVARLRRFGGRG